MKPLFFIAILGLTACNHAGDADKETQKLPSRSDTSTSLEMGQNHDSLEFHPYKHGLFVSSLGQLAYRTIDNSKPGAPHDHFLTTINTDSLDYEQKSELSRVLDTASFTHLGDLYYKDKNHIYYHFQMLDGGTFFIVWEADPNSFRVLDSTYYAKDKQRVFYRGSVLEGADNKTFKVISQPNKEVYLWRAKDKHHVYEGGDIVKKVETN